MAKLRLAPSLRHGQRSAAVARVRRTSRRVSLAGRIRTYTEEAPPGPVDSPTGYLAADRSPRFARGWEPRLKNEALCTYKISHRLPTCSDYRRNHARTRFTIEPDRERQRRSAYSRDLIDQCTATILSNCRSRANSATMVALAKQAGVELALRGGQARSHPFCIRSIGIAGVRPALRTSCRSRGLACGAFRASHHTQRSDQWELRASIHHSVAANRTRGSTTFACCQRAEFHLKAHIRHTAFRQQGRLLRPADFLGNLQWDAQHGLPTHYDVVRPRNGEFVQFRPDFGWA